MLHYEPRLCELLSHYCVFILQCRLLELCYVHCVPKSISLLFDNHFGKYGLILKIHQLIHEKILYVCTERLPPHLQYVATPCESRKSKMLVILTASSTNC